MAPSQRMHVFLAKHVQTRLRTALHYDDVPRYTCSVCYVVQCSCVPFCLPRVFIVELQNSKKIPVPVPVQYQNKFPYPYRKNSRFPVPVPVSTISSIFSRTRTRTTWNIFPYPYPYPYRKKFPFFPVPVPVPVCNSSLSCLLFFIVAFCADRTSSLSDACTSLSFRIIRVAPNSDLHRIPNIRLEVLYKIVCLMKLDASEVYNIRTDGIILLPKI